MQLGKFTTFELDMTRTQTEISCIVARQRIHIMVSFNAKVRNRGGNSALGQPKTTMKWLLDDFDQNVSQLQLKGQIDLI